MKRRTVLVSLAITATISVGAFLYWQHHRFKHLAVHHKGMMYRSGWLDPEPLAEVIEEYQIRTVVNLCAPGEMGEARWEGERHAVTNAGARLIELPMTLSVNPADAEITDHLEILSDPDNYPLLVHCQHGVTRTAKFLSIYDVKFRGLTAEKSLADQPLFGRDDHNVNVRAFAKNFEKQHKELFPTISAKQLDVLRQ